MPAFSQIKETCLYVQDLDRTEAFYHHQLGLPLISKVPGRHVFFRAGSSVLLCFLPEVTRQEEVLPPHYAAGKQHLAFECAPGAYEEWQQLLIEQGIPIIHEARWGDHYRSCYFHDPDGHVLEVVEPGMWGK
ncbi:MAG: glyoxalase [Bacteroidetes bacterium]|nr:MAG: glyoxalase [Bacteroidota bacterium]